MEVISGETADELYVSISNRMLEKGKYSFPRGLKTLEIQDAWLQLDNPSESIVNLPSRDINKDYLMGEFNWYLNGSLSIRDIEKHSKFWSKLVDSNGTVNSNYGEISMRMKYAGKSQLEWVVNSLNKDKQTRQAVIVYNQPHLHRYEGNKDFVCTLSQLFRVNPDGNLDSVTHMRSNDLIYGLSYDLPWFTHLQKEVSLKTGIPLGNYYHYAMSLHVYEKHFNMLKKMSEEKL